MLVPSRGVIIRQVVQQNSPEDRAKAFNLIRNASIENQFIKFMPVNLLTSSNAIQYSSRLFKNFFTFSLH
jgi:hypothetical protein